MTSSWNFRLAPAIRVDLERLRSGGLEDESRSRSRSEPLDGRGPRKPRQEGVPQWQACTFFCENGLGYVSGEVAWGNSEVEGLLEVVIVSQLVTGHDTVWPGEKSHARFSSNSPFDHGTIGLARVIDESGDSSTSSINDHVLIEYHEVVALQIVSLEEPVAN